MFDAPTTLPPEAIRAHHDVEDFSNGRHWSLDHWLKERALASEGLSARTYVVSDPGRPRKVIGYYAMSAAMERRAVLPSAKLRRAMPDEIPLLLIGRLAVDAAFHGRGIGKDLLADALRRCVAASEIVGVRAILVHAIDAEAARFYGQYGFVESPLGSDILLIPIEVVRASAKR